MQSVLRKEVFSPYDISLISGKDPEVVRKWLASGELHSFYTRGDHQRVHLEELERFFRAKNIPLPQHWTGDVGKFRVLLVEDDPDMLELIRDLLKEDSKLDVETEDSGFGAAMKISQWHPDLILLDFIMPGMDGFDVCKRLKSDPLTSDIPILAITSLSRPENKKEVVKAGVSAFLGKPFQSDEMLRYVRELLGVPSDLDSYKKQ